MSVTSKQKGDFLEKIFGQICSGIKNAKIEHDARVTGRSGTTRKIDYLITGDVGLFKVKILVDPKNYADPVDIKDVESIAGMVEDVGANLGVIVCPTGFTEGAKNRAEMAGIQLYEIYDHSLGNTNLLIPVRLILPRTGGFGLNFSATSAAGPFHLIGDESRWRLHIDDKVLTYRQVPIYLWNNDKVPQKKGHHVVEIGAVKITDSENTQSVQYCDLACEVEVVEDYFLKLFPASFVRRVDETGKMHLNLKLDLYSKDEDFLKFGWQQYGTMEEMNRAADIENQPEGVRDFVMRANYAYAIEE